MRIILSILFYGCIICTFGQNEIAKNNKDFSILGGIQLNDFDYGKLGLQYRKMMENGKWKMKFSATHDKFNGKTVLVDELIYLTDSLKIYRTQGTSNRHLLLSMGIDYDANNYLSFGTQAIIGFNSGSTYIIDNGFTFDNWKNEWVIDNEAVFNYHGATAREQDTQSNTFQHPFSAYCGRVNYLVYGLNVSIAAKIPIKNRFEFVVQYTPELTRNYFVSKSILYSGTDTFVYEFSSFTAFNQYVDLGLRFKF